MTTNLIPSHKDPPQDSWHKGLVIALGAVVVISPDALLIRLIDLDTWTIVFGRGLLTSLAMLLLVSIKGRIQGTTLTEILKDMRLAGFQVALLSGGANILFVLSITNTHVANTLLILSASPILAALFSRIILGEHIASVTWGASTCAVAAVILISWGGIESTGYIGILAALGATVLSALNLTIIRRNRERALQPALIGAGLFSALAVVGLASPTSISGSDAWLLFLNGFIIVPAAVSLMFLAPRFMPAPDVALILLVEAPLGPLWVWMALGEVPPNKSLVGGVALLGVVTAHTWSQRSKRQPTVDSWE